MPNILLSLPLPFCFFVFPLSCLPLLSPPFPPLTSHSLFSAPPLSLCCSSLLCLSLSLLSPSSFPCVISAHRVRYGSEQITRKRPRSGARS